ncbi:hypothetical protein G6F57_009051 [Rhizopus arrhizus]|nr:hypothetical protein G6F21_008971 [Rhizopus arrhizus]KAG1416985.1 hypothetical protein G6F58_005706 [Rhizopus delemar]KAG0808526.1 hypothetical protein G6F20_009504 [Rhizopus arrhizus]KAG0825754.1 hypothetical protein G6F19_009658 [Rhizopus arrhizus]KAG0827200.1 hypothetical protein G6F18_009597 [Rhizopus arrhizus]
MMTFTAKSLSIMREAYEKKHIENDSLLSPPLTPTETSLPSPVTDNAPWYSCSRKRKTFIESYCRMVPSLRSASTNDRVFALNVYRDLLLLGKRNEEKKIDSSNCTMLDKPAVLPSKKRKLNPPAPKDKQLSCKKRRVSSVLPTGKDAASAFDSIDIQSDDVDFYPPGWVPCREALDYTPVKVTWKGAPLCINQEPFYHLLHPVEASMASILRLSPIQYLRCKRILILAARTLKHQNISFTKSVAQKLCRVDVNKTSALWTAFGQLGWFDESN